MSLPQGVIWQDLRRLALETVPPGTRAGPASPPALSSWLRSGSFSVVSASPKLFVLEGASVDIGAVLLAESGFLLDQAQEHSIHIRHQLASGRWFSPAWVSVSVYYWAYFLVLALTRMTGRTPWFLSQKEARFLRDLGPGAPSNVGAGPRIISCGPQTSATMREFAIKAAPQTRLHDVVWRLWFDSIRKLVLPLSDQKSVAPELRLYLPQIQAANALGDSWPSDYRNLVNYVPGLAYGAARGRTPTATFAAVPVSTALTTEEAIGRLESDGAAVTSRSDIADQLAPCTRLLLSLTFVLDALAHSLFRDIVQRRDIDNRWLTSRTAIARLHYKSFADSEWPIRAVAG